MRHRSVLAMMAGLCAMAAIACQRSDVEAVDPDAGRGAGKGPGRGLLAIETPSIENVGILHNNGLEYLRACYDHQRAFASNQAQADYILALTGAWFRSMLGWDSNAVNCGPNQGDLAAMLSRRYPDNDADVWTALKADPVFTANVSANDVAAIDAAMTVFALPTQGMSQGQIAQRIVGVADSLIALSKAVNLGELPASFLRLMKGSAMHWSEHPVRTDECPGPPPEMAQLIQIDCVGYLVGWWVALSAEIGANGHADISNQWKRIGAGAAAAISWSMGGPVRRFFGG